MAAWRGESSADGAFEWRGALFPRSLKRARLSGLALGDFGRGAVEELVVDLAEIRQVARPGEAFEGLLAGAAAHGGGFGRVVQQREEGVGEVGDVLGADQEAGFVVRDDFRVRRRRRRR